VIDAEASTEAIERRLVVLLVSSAAMIKEQLELRAARA
jgi:hypothetical protein